MSTSATFRSAAPFLSRRGVLQAGAGLTFVLGAQGLVRIAQGEPATTSSPAAPNPWVRIAGDGTITIVFPSTEMGQGTSTALPLILAEELDADWPAVRVEQLDSDDRTFGNPLFGNVLYTAGSTAVAGYFDPLRRAGAQARLVLMRAAAQHWDVAAEELATEPSTVVHAASDRRLAYGEIALLGDLDLAVPEIDDAALKPRDAYRLIGSDVQRFDVAAKSTGRERYVIDVQVPQMLYAAVARSPVEGERALEVDDAAALATPGVVRTLALPDGIAVIAERLDAALTAKDLLAVTWSEESPARAFDSEADLEAYAGIARDLDRAGTVWRSAGDAVGALDAAERVLEAEYRSDYAYHAQMEPMAAVAAVDEDGLGAEVWAATQTQSWTTRTITEVLGTTADRVRLHMITMGGSFGRRTELDQAYVRDALLASRAVGRPVKVVWTREDDVHHGAFRPAAAQLLRAGLDAEGRLQGWHHRVATPSVIAYFNPLRWSQVEPQDIISMRGAESQFYGLPDLLAEHVITERRARLAPWRAIGASYTSFAAEAFMDELARAAGADPVAFRLQLLTDNPRGHRLLETVAEMAGWGRPGGDTALGVAFAGYGNTMAAGIAEVALDRETGIISVPRFWAAVDAGLVIQPDNAAAQIEGGIVFGVSSALKERITIRGGEVEQNNFYDYEILRANEVPEIRLHIADSDERPTGLGEVGTPMVPAAIANGFFALTGTRLRHLPFTPDRVSSALS